MVCVVAPLDHCHAIPEFALSASVALGQIVVLPCGTILAVGRLIALFTNEEDAMQPLVLVTVTLNNPACETLMAAAVAPLLHK